VYYRYTMSFNSHLYLSFCSLHVYACHGNAGVENVYNGCRTNAAVEAAYDRVWSLALQFANVLPIFVSNCVSYL